jgi:L-iditol 2-dehydrogenase
MSPVAVQYQRAVVLHGPKDLRLEERAFWPPQQNHAQVAVKSTGLCGSDCESLLRPKKLNFEQIF